MKKTIKKNLGKIVLTKTKGEKDNKKRPEAAREL